MRKLLGKLRIWRNLTSSRFRDLVYGAASHASLGQLEEARLAVAGLQDWNSRVSLAKIRYVFPYRSDVDRQRVLDDLRKASLPQG